MAAAPVVRLSVNEYLERERTALDKSEYVRGEVFAMAGGSFRHGSLAGAFITLLRNALRDRGCTVFSSDVKVGAPTNAAYLYPDVSVVCGELLADPEHADVLTNPIAIVEVLSPSTADYDRGLKFTLYREISSLREYVLVHQEAAWIEHFSRLDDGAWKLTDVRELTSVLQLPALSIEVPLDELYRGVFDLPL